MMTWPTSLQFTPTFTSAEWEALRVLHLRYQRDHDLFSSQELARLRFIAWLHHMRRI